MSWNTLVSAETLASALDDERVRIVDCRHSLATPESGRKAWQAAHLPGAVHAHLDLDLSGEPGPGRGRHPWPEAVQITARLGEWGISPAHRVVAYDDGDGAHAARLWFMLRALGHREVTVLDGGWARWQALGLPTDDRVPQYAPMGYEARFERARLLDPAQVQAHLAVGGLLLDARAGERFRGEVEPIDPVAGHVPGALNRPFVLNLGEGRFKPATTLRVEFDALLDGRAPDGLVAMCGSGVTACHHLLAMEHAGLPGAKLFTGSWSGWIDEPARAVAKDG